MNEATTDTNFTEEMKNQEMRRVSLGFASGIYRNSDGEYGDHTPYSFISFANEIYKYIKEGKTNA